MVSLVGLATDSFGSRLQLLREARGSTLRQLARDAEISAAFLCELEKERKGPSAAVLARLAAVLDVSMDHLWHGDLPNSGTGSST